LGGGYWLGALVEEGIMGPEKDARNMLHCDGCGVIIPKAGKYRIDNHGYLLCIECAKSGDLQREVAV